MTWRARIDRRSGAVLQPGDPGYDDDALVVTAHEAESQESIRRREQGKKPKLRLKHTPWEPADGNYLSTDFGYWLPLHHALLRSRAFTTCSASEHQVLCHLLTQFDGKNNGKLTATLPGMQKQFHWPHSPQRLRTALLGLQEKKLVRQVKERIGADPAWYALTWLKNRTKKGRS